jgi:gamma-glutamyltranspeptidase / glutathione hydrolase
MPIRSTAVAVPLLCACLVPPASAQDAPTPSRPRPAVGRSVVATRYGIVAASQPLAAAAGVEILERGGTAADAAVAANAVMGLLEPTGNGIGGDMFALVYNARTRRVHALNASGWAPAGLPALLKQRGDTGMPQRGIHSVTVPGVVAGWDELRLRFGTKGFGELLAPAIRYADEGVPIAEVTAGNWRNATAMLAAHPNSRKLFLMNGDRAPRAGELFRNPDLANSLRRIALRGREGYYTGATAEAILSISREQGGTMTAADLSEFRAEWVEPISTTYRGWTVYEIPPNSQGIAALEMLNIMERFPMADYGWASPRAMHTMIESKKLAYADLLRYVGDPRFARVPVAQLLDKGQAERRASQIEMTRANCAVEPVQVAGVSTNTGSETIYLTVIDRDGNIVSLIQSNYSGFGSGLVPPNAGFMLHNRGALFSLVAGSPNELAARKRPLHTIIPAMMTKADTAIGFGIMGGWNQAQAHAQFVSHIADFGFSIQEALEAGRFTKSTFAGCDLDIEPLVPVATRDSLTALGHLLKVSATRSGTFGFGQAVMGVGSGVHFGASEPRHDGAAIPETPTLAPVRTR